MFLKETVGCNCLTQTQLWFCRTFGNSPESNVTAFNHVIKVHAFNRHFRHPAVCFSLFSQGKMTGNGPQMVFGKKLNYRKFRRISHMEDIKLN